MDYLSLKAAATEAKTRFSGRKVRETKQLSPREAVFRLEREKSLLLSIDPVRPGLFILDADFPSTTVQSPFGDLLGAKIRGAVITTISMPEPGERVVFFTFEPGWPAKSGKPVSLVLEVMGRHSNLAALNDAGRILQPMKAVTAEKSPGRPFLAGEAWTPPPPRPGFPPEEVHPQGLPHPGDPEAVDGLLGAVRGLSPYTAHQALLMASNGTREGIAEAIASMLESSHGDHGWLHHVGGRTHLCPFEPSITPGSGETTRFFKPFSAASAEWRKTGPGDSSTRPDETGRLAAELDRMEERLTSILAQLDRERERCSSHEGMRIMGETLLINLSTISPGAGSVSLPNPYMPGETLSLELDPSLSALQNADRLFNEARRLKRGLEGIPSRVAQIEKDLSNIRNARRSLMEKSDRETASGLLKELAPAPPKETGTPFRAYRGPGRKYTFEGFTILVGRNGADNEKVTFQAAGPNDLWLHARDYAGSHVVILSGKGNVPENVLYYAAALAAENSGARNESSPEIMVTERKWVRKIKGGKPGKVTVQRFRTVRPRKQDSDSVG